MHLLLIAMHLLRPDLYVRCLWNLVLLAPSTTQAVGSLVKERHDHTARLQIAGAGSKVYDTQ